MSQDHHFQSISYHHVGVAMGADQQVGTNISVATLASHFEWLATHNYHPISIDDLEAAEKGEAALPPNPVLLTFDDGLSSVHKNVLPLLKIYNFPALVAPVTSWIEYDHKEGISYDGRTLFKSDFMTWSEMKDLVDSGLVEIATHSHNLHRGVLGNAFGNDQPAVTTRIYDPATGSYESELAHFERIRSDLQTSVDLIGEKLGIKVRAMVWPYGKYNQVAMDAAHSVGLSYMINLDSPDNLLSNKTHIGRHLIRSYTTLEKFAWGMKNPASAFPSRVVHVDLDYLYDPNPQQMNRNLDILLDRIKSIEGVTDVYLQAFADPDGDGVAQSLYFPNRHLPVRSDIFNRAAWQLKTRCGVKVYAWMPVLGFVLPHDYPAVYVERAPSDHEENRYTRLSLFDPYSREMILQIYEDLAAYADFDGLLFHDDAFLRDDEEYGPHALAFYESEWDLPSDMAAIRADHSLLTRWTHLKTKHLINFTHEIHERASRYRRPLKTARNMYAIALMMPHSEEWMAQSYSAFLEAYDFTAIMAMPYMERAKNAESWLTELIQRARCYDPHFTKTLFELQSRDWHGGDYVPDKTMLNHMELLWRNGAIHYGYYPDDFIAGKPGAKEIGKGLTAKEFRGK